MIHPIAIASLSALACCGCQDPGRFAGGTTDTGNAVSASVSGTILDTAGRPAAGAGVRLRTADYLAPIGDLSKKGISDYDGGADSLGAFAIEDIDSGRYRLELVGPGSGAAPDLDLSRPGSLPGFRLELGRKALAPDAKVTGSLRLLPGSRRGFVQVYGMERSAQAEAGTGDFALRLPAGGFRLRFTDPECGSACTRVLGIQVRAGIDLDLGGIDLAEAWPHAAVIAIDAPAGIGSGYPLLVRLDSTAIDFAQAKPDGSDLRFMAEDGSRLLPFAIESWDPAAGSAAVWVRLGDSADSAIRMLWGNPEAMAPGVDEPVFDTAHFSAVWHFADGPFRDATAYRNDGMDSGSTAAVPGVAGAARDFAAGGAGIRIADAPGLRLGAGDFALSAWVRDAGGSGTRQVICKRTATADYELQVTPEGRAKGFAGRNPGIASATGNSDVADGAWHLLALVRRGDSLFVFRDGDRESAIAAEAMGSTDNAADVFLGRDPGKATGEGWAGELDEVRILRGAPSDGWMRFDYLTQAPGAGRPAWKAIR